MLPKLQVPNNFKLKYVFDGRVLGKALAPNSLFLLMNINPITWVNKGSNQKLRINNYSTLELQHNS
jgi:hypothetical protein